MAKDPWKCYIHIGLWSKFCKVDRPTVTWNQCLHPNSSCFRVIVLTRLLFTGTLWLLLFFAPLFCRDCWVQTSACLCDFRQPRTRSAASATCTWLSATTPIPWQATNSVCCWRDKPSASLPRLANWATWAPCTQHWETSLMPSSATSSTWASQRYSIVFYVMFLDIHRLFFKKSSLYFISFSA